MSSSRMLGITVVALTGLSLMMIGSSHPLILALVIMAMTLAVGVVASSAVAFWVLLALLLVFLGGMMVIFSYMTTLASNDKMFISPLISGLAVVLALMGGYCCLNSSFPVGSFHLGLIYSSSSGNMVLFLTGYLLLSLLAIVKMAQAHKGALTTWN